MWPKHSVNFQTPFFLSSWADFFFYFLCQNVNSVRYWSIKNPNNKCIEGNGVQRARDSLICRSSQLVISLQVCVGPSQTVGECVCMLWMRFGGVWWAGFRSVWVYGVVSGMCGQLFLDARMRSVNTNVWTVLAQTQMPWATSQTSRVAICSLIPKQQTSWCCQKLTQFSRPCEAVHSWNILAWPRLN